MIPIILKLKKAKYKEIARAQDIIIEELYKIFDKAVLHGGTGIWRCYDGNRFSEDIDMYLPRDLDKINTFFESLKNRDFIIIKKKISENSIYSNLGFNREFVRFEAVFKRINGHLREYKTVEGNIITIYSLTPEEIIREKVNAYLKRLKIRDIYDIFFLLRYIKSKKEIEKELRRLIREFKMPIDKEDLRFLIIEGIVPSTEKMLEYIKSWLG